MKNSRRDNGPGEAAIAVTRSILTRHLFGAWRQTRHHAPMALALLATSCGTLTSATNVVMGPPPVEIGTPGYIHGFVGDVVADEPRAAIVGRDTLSAGGNAMDAAVAVGLALAVTLPSRAGLGGGGACVAYAPNPKWISGGRPEAVLFLPGAPKKTAAADSDRPASTPMLARGLYLLHSRYGSRPFDTLVLPAEQLARLGVPVSRALNRDLEAVSGPLAADPNARSVFLPGGKPLAEGAQLIQPALGATLAQLRVAGIGDLYQGILARRVERSSRLAGGPISLTDLRDALPTLAATLDIAVGPDRVSFLPPPADGGLAALGAFQVLTGASPTADAANARGLALASRWRESGAEPRSLLASPQPGIANLGALPASTSFVVVDRDGNSVACALTLNNLFGTGRILPGIGYIAGASPTSVPPALLSAAIAWNPRKEAFRAAVAGSGQEGAPLAVASVMAEALSGAATPRPAPEPGRANAVTCTGYLPDAEKSCVAVTDPRGSGLAIGGV